MAPPRVYPPCRDIYSGIGRCAQVAYLVRRARMLAPTAFIREMSYFMRAPSRARWDWKPLLLLVSPEVRARNRETGIRRTPSTIPSRKATGPSTPKNRTRGSTGSARAREKMDMAFSFLFMSVLSPICCPKSRDFLKWRAPLDTRSGNAEPTGALGSFGCRVHGDGDPHGRLFAGRGIILVEGTPIRVVIVIVRRRHRDLDLGDGSLS